MEDGSYIEKVRKVGWVRFKDVKSVYIKFGSFRLLSICFVGLDTWFRC